MNKTYCILTLDTPLFIENKQIFGVFAAMPEYPFIISEKCIQEYVEYLVATDFIERFNEICGIDQNYVTANRNLYTNIEKTNALLLPSYYVNKFTTDIKIFNHAVFENYPIHYQVLFDQEIPEDEEWVKNEDYGFITSEENRDKFRQLYKN